MDRDRRGGHALLPKSGVGVVGPWLVIAPPGNPVIRLDLRLLDRVVPRPQASELDDEADDGAQGLPEGSSADSGCEVLLVCGELEVGLLIEDGPQAAADIVKACSEHTHAAISNASAASESSSGVVERASGQATCARLFVVSSTADAGQEPTDALVGHSFDLTEPLMFVGRSDDNELIIDHSSISRMHAKVTRDPATGRYMIRDLDAANGVRINGERCDGAELRDGDVVDFGHVRVRFDDPAADPPSFPATAPRLDAFLFIGRDAVLVHGDHIRIGSLQFRIGEVREYALRGANIPLSGGRLVQAAIALLVVALHEAATGPA